MNYFHTTDKTPYAEIAGRHRKEIVPVLSEEMKQYISQYLFEKTGNAPVKSEIDRLQAVMAAEAIYKGDERTVHLRCAPTAEGIEIDLNNETGQCIKITSEGWSITTPQSSFYRPKSSREMMVPQRGASWDLFQKHFKTKNEEELKLLIGFMLSSLRPQAPSYAILVLQGEQGSAKSTTARMVKALVDPSSGATRSLTRKEQDLFIAAKNNHLVSFDNISLIKNDLSDSLCRLATGGSFSARTLYTNDSETLIELCKPVLLNGITDFVTRPDLASRSIIVELAPIPETERKPITEVMADFEADAPFMLGVLMDGLCAALKSLSNTSLEKLPRMADVTLWCTAAEESLQWEKNGFLTALNNNQLNAVLNSLSTDIVAIAIRSFMAAHESGSWKGTATNLLTELTRTRPYADSSRSWPTTPAYLSQYLSRLAPNLRKIGLDFVGRDRRSNERLLVLKKLSNFLEMHSTANADSWNSEIINSYVFDEDDGFFGPDDAHDGNDANMR